MLPVKRISPGRALVLVNAASRSPFANPGVRFPAYYLHRWHLLPEGYLSRRSVAAYELLVRGLYYLRQEGRAERAVLAELGRRRALLELGCGTGRFLERAARSIAPASLVGLDLSPYMLERAAGRIAGRARLLHADSGDLPLPGASFDAVVALHHFGHLPPLAARRALGEARRVIRPGGRLVVLEHAWHRLRWPGFDLVRRRSVAGGLLHVLVLRCTGDGVARC